jgi:hypothetical protein
MATKILYYRRDYTLEGLANGFLPERGLAKVNVDSCNSAQVRNGEIS